MSSRWRRRGILRQDDAAADGDNDQNVGGHVQSWETSQSQALAQQEAQEAEEARLRVEAYINDLEEELAELRVKVDGREMAMQTLETTVSMQSNTIQELQEELEDAQKTALAAAEKAAAATEVAAAAEAATEAALAGSNNGLPSAAQEAREEQVKMLRIEMEDMYNQHQESEERFQTTIDRLESELGRTRLGNEQMKSDKLELKSDNERLKKKVHEKKKLVVSLTKKLTECQMYIKELTDELERLYKECGTPDTAKSSHQSNGAR
jgi:chromosome segregation ATPase